jgi:hypothetical protein
VNMIAILNKLGNERGHALRVGFVALLVVFLSAACSKHEQANTDAQRPIEETSAPAPLFKVEPAVPNTTEAEHQPIASVKSVGSEKVKFSPESCLREHFPLALGMPYRLVPLEVKFYCAAPWDTAAFEHVERTLLAGGFSPTDAIVRSVPEARQAILRESLAMALRGADMGPTGMRAAWYSYKFIPSLYALHAHTSDESIVEKAFKPEDIKILRDVAGRLKWNTTVLRKIQHVGGAQLPENADLTSVTRIILAG